MAAVNVWVNTVSITASMRAGKYLATVLGKFYSLLFSNVL